MGGYGRQLGYYGTEYSTPRGSHHGSAGTFEDTGTSGYQHDPHHEYDSDTDQGDYDERASGYIETVYIEPSDSDYDSGSFVTSEDSSYASDDSDVAQNLMFPREFHPSRLALPTTSSNAKLMFRYDRSASIAVTAFGAVFNLALAVQVITASRSLKWEPESEWEASGDSWQVDGIKFVWGLCCAHFALAATVCMVGFIGILKVSLVFYLLPSSTEYNNEEQTHTSDFSFCTFVTAIATYCVFHASARAAICEELSHHPEFLQDLMEMGLNLENCERWLERAGLAFVALMFILLVIRLHFLLAVANLYSQLTRHASLYSRSPSRFRFQDSTTLQRIYLLPPSDEESCPGDDVELVYAPIPISSIPKNLRDTATEAWVSCNVPPSADADCHSRTPRTDLSHAHSCEHQEPQQHTRPHRHRRYSHSHSHSHSHRHSRSSSATRTGTIRLPIVPDEGLLPGYHGTKA
ncbi:hypothetical protein DXG01_012888 [Tephrocybe rancida]|nr:hypothetical protein DXG01_012888 [Tephrocybe rancida]